MEEAIYKLHSGRRGISPVQPFGRLTDKASVTLADRSLAGHVVNHFRGMCINGTELDCQALLQTVRQLGNLGPCGLC